MKKYLTLAALAFAFVYLTPVVHAETIIVVRHKHHHNKHGHHHAHHHHRRNVIFINNINV